MPRSLNRNLLATSSLVILIVLLYSHDAPGFSIREFLGLEAAVDKKTEPSARPAQTAQTAQVAPDKVKTTDKNTREDFPYKLDFNEIQKIISVVDENQRKILLTDEEAFSNFVKNEATNKSLLSAAHANKVDQNERYQFIAQRGTENIIREIYLKQLIASRIPEDFPSEEQIQSYFEQNKDKFVLEERVQVWQIFLPFKDASDLKETEIVKKRAESIINDLNKNTINFSAAAEKYSRPPAGKYNGGYMGLVKISELKPEIKEPLMKLFPDKISAPIKTAEGIHILKRGNIIPKQDLEYEEVKSQIDKLLTTQFENQLKKAIFKQAGETYPVDINDQIIEEWRLKLRTNFKPDPLSEMQ